MNQLETYIGPKKISYIFLTLLAVILIPYFGAYYHYVIHLGKEIPENYLHFPPTKIGKPDPNVTTNIIGYGFFAFFILFYFFPQLFGFQKSLPFLPPSFTRQSFPKWFWIGLVMWLVVLYHFATQKESPKWLLHWGFIPLCWGFILLLDGIVFKINEGKSLIKDSPTEIIAMGIISISGWLIFEYLNFFVEHNWGYVKADLVKDHDQYLVYAAIGSSAFIPMAFEWYQLIRKWKIFDTKYKQGPKVKLPKWIRIVLLTVAAFSLFYVPRQPDNLFFIIWISPLIIFAIILSLLGIWTPFKPIEQKGDWSALVVFSLTFLIQGFLLESWNWLSATHDIDGHLVCFNPAYWQYCIPFVNKAHIFEMPLLGYMGYLLFSIHCWLWYIIFVSVTGVKSQFTLDKDFK